MNFLSGVNKAVVERKRYTVDYSPWLETSEVLTNFQMVLTPVTTPPLVADGAFISADFTILTVFLSGGLGETLYTLSFVTTTSEGQIKRDDMQVFVTA